MSPTPSLAPPTDERHLADQIADHLAMTETEGGGSNKVVYSLLRDDFMAASQLKAPEPAIAASLAPSWAQYSMFFFSLADAQDNHPDLLLPVWHARALAAHLSTHDLIQAQLSIATEIRGDSTYEMSKSCLARFSAEAPMPFTFSRYGQSKTPWQAFFSDYASEFDEHGALELCSMIHERAPSAPPPRWISELESNGIGLGALWGAAQAFPALCSQRGFLRTLDACMDPEHERAPETEEEARAWGQKIYELGRAHGMPITDRPFQTFKSPALASWTESRQIEEASGQGAPARSAPRI
jgi:hypothetical protein